LTYIGDLHALDYTVDNDEALEVWIKTLFSGEYPYFAQTQLNNPLTPLPFNPIYSIPFYLVGEVALQNVVSVILLVIIVYHFADNDNIKYFLSIILVSAIFYKLLINQSDHLTVNILTVTGLYLLYKNKLLYSSLLFGALIATRGYVWIVIPLTLVYIWDTSGYRECITTASVYTVISSSLILPFLLWHPTAFLTQAPLGAQGSILSVSFIPYSQYIITALIIVFSLFLCIQTKGIWITTFMTYFVFTAVVYATGSFGLVLKVLPLVILSGTFATIVSSREDENTIRNNKFLPH
jgi:uncharacterized membrane protein